MNQIYRLILVCLLLGHGFAGSGQIRNHEAPRLDIVLCLDLSGSTNGLIDNVRETIWSIVNLSGSFEPGQQLRIGVVCFSRPSFGKSNFYVKVQSELTSDFDQVQAGLYDLKSQVEKGDQFVSNALETAHLQMNWSKSEHAVKIIFLVGNGSVSTGTRDYRSVVDEISSAGINLVPVYCLRSQTTPDREGWEHIGRISGFDCESVVVLKRDPFVKSLPDQAKLKKLNHNLNRLMLPYTKAGIESATHIRKCDNKAMLYMPDAYENRLYYRVSANSLTRSKQWDLVSAGIASAAELQEYDLSLLPDTLHAKTPAELFDLLTRMRTERTKIINEIKKLLPDERQQFINAVLLGGTFEKDHVLERIFLQNIIKITGKYSIRLK